MVSIREVKLYSCTYKNTYSVIVAADGAEQAHGVFEIFLAERGERNVTLNHHNVHRQTRDARPIYTLA